LGWQVVGEYVDNDVSAFSGKVRPAYQRLLRDIADGMVDGLIVWHQDRLHRRPIELEDFFTVLDRAGIAGNVKTVTGNSDFGTGDGIFTARLMGAVAAKESADKSRRVARKHEQRASQGIPHKGAIRPFGYESDFTTVRPAEAQIVRDLAARFLAGESLRSLAEWLNDAEVRRVTGGTGWISTTVRGILVNPRYAGLMTHRGQVVGPGKWEAIIDEDTHRRILVTIAAKKASGRRTPQTYLLTGLLRCGKCGNRLYSSARQEGASNGVNRAPVRTTRRRYVCMSGPDHGGCGRLTAVAEPVEQLVTDAVLYALDTPELAAALSGKDSPDEQSRALASEIERLQAKQTELSDAYAADLIDMSEWRRARATITDRLEAARRRLASRTRTDTLHGLVGHATELAAQWPNLSLSRQHAIIRALIEQITIGPGTPGARAFDTERLTITWRL
jgi:site-specific DNA recombinase